MLLAGTSVSSFPPRRAAVPPRRARAAHVHRCSSLQEAPMGQLQPRTLSSQRMEPVGAQQESAAEDGALTLEPAEPLPAWASSSGPTVQRDPAPSSMFEYVPEDVIKEFEAKIQGDVQSVSATLVAGIGVITWWRGVWALLDHYIEDSVFGHWMCIITGLMIIIYIRVSGLKLTNFFPPS